MEPKVTLEGKLLKARNAPFVLHEKIEQWARTQGKKRKRDITKEHAIIELLESATKNVRL